MIAHFALMIGAAATPANAPEVPIVQRSTSRSLDIPDEIAPAVTPYFMCLMNGINNAAREAGGLEQSEFEASAITVRSNCSDEREAASEKGLQMLKQQGFGSEDRQRALVEETLISIEGQLQWMGPPAPEAQRSDLMPQINNLEATVGGTAIPTALSLVDLSR